MKSRIIDKLKAFSSEDYKKHPDSMFRDICSELLISAEELHQKSKIVLKKIIHNYGAFDISTIDAFTHRVIRTFAFDLKLPVNFEVELDQDYFLTKAVDNLIDRAGTDEKLTKLLVDFAIEKADDDKSWDISNDFRKISKLLLSENDSEYIALLKDKTLEDFRILKTQITKKVTVLEKRIKEKAETTLSLISEARLEFDDFNRKSLPNYFLSLSEKKYNLNLDSAWQTTLVEGGSLYPKRVSEDVAQIINSIQQDLADAFLQTKDWLIELKFNKAIYKNITPLSVINALQKELETLKETENKVLISDFNTIISKEIRNQPTPFIYERLGEKFKHYFIDEFQDTSKMQWENLMPLMDNALSSNNGSAMLVGDAKQSIYRWRGGDAQQFVNLYKGVGNPFQAEAKVKKLDTNYRSYKAIIDFNNSFFSFISDAFFTKEDFKMLYEDAHQKTLKKQDGYVNLSFLEFENAEERTEAYIQKTLEIINSCIELGYSLKDICVLVRKKKEGIAISKHLTSKSINIVSSETLLLNNSPKVRLINLLLTLLIKPENQKLKLDVLCALSEVFTIENKHAFFSTYLEFSTPELFENLSAFGLSLNHKRLIQLPLYEATEELIRGLNLCTSTSDAYIQFYLDTVLDYSNKEASDILGFLDYFDSKKENLGIATPSNLDAVSVMTIHKSKGLEFPIVIFPFADLDMYREIEPKEWFTLKPEDYNGFNHTLINYSKDFTDYGETGEVIYNNHQSQLELDSINLLYVSLTRAVEQLYVVSKKDINSKGEVNEKTYAGLFIKYLKAKGQWEDQKPNYAFGEKFRLTDRTVSDDLIEDVEFISTPKESHNLKVITKAGLLWETEQEQAINYGNLIHLVMSKIKTIDDVEEAIRLMISDGYIESSESTDLKQLVLSVVTHQQISAYFSKTYEILNEKDIITKEGQFLRPDRIAINENSAILIDYKTGAIDNTHQNQLETYADALEEMNYKIEKKLLVYVNEDIKIIEVK